MNEQTVLQQLKVARNACIVCPECEREVPLNKADLFLAHNLSRRAEKARQERLEQIAELRQEIKDLKSRKIERLTNVTRATNFGKLIEKFAPILDGFHCDPTECHGIFDPIDYIVFHGQSKGVIEHIEFIDVKSGRARLTQLQEFVKSTIESGGIEFSHLGR